MINVCYDRQTSIENCGTCGTRCGGVDGGAPTCSGGVCM